MNRNPPLPSTPATLGVCVCDWNSEATAQQLEERASGFTRELSRYIDVSRLDGFTLCIDYRKAPNELDRGDEGTIVLTPSNDTVIGGMTPSVTYGLRTADAGSVQGRHWLEGRKL